jgi:hypothetical protein
MRILAIGHRCATSTLLQQLGERTESFPFDWCVTSIDTVRQCILDDFKAFLMPDNYEIFSNETYNVNRGLKCHWLCETVCCNRFYEKALTHEKSTYHLNLALTHKRMDIPEDVEYAQRCVDRFQKAMASGDIQWMLHLYPIMDHATFRTSHATIVSHSFRPFCEVLHAKFPKASVRTLFVFIVYHEPRTGTLETLYQDEGMIVMVLYCPDGMADIGAFFEGHRGEEMAHLLRDHIGAILNRR